MSFLQTLADIQRFGPYYIRPPPFMINFWGLLTLDLFWTEDTSVPKIGRPGGWWTKLGQR
eukprot:4678965-Alexandrium_andersonii.AAC.1